MAKKYLFQYTNPQGNIAVKQGDIEEMKRLQAAGTLLKAGPVTEENIKAWSKVAPTVTPIAQKFWTGKTFLTDPKAIAEWKTAHPGGFDPLATTTDQSYWEQKALEEEKAGNIEKARWYRIRRPSGAGTTTYGIADPLGTLASKLAPTAPVDVKTGGVMEGDTRINPVTGIEETYKYNEAGQIGWWPTPTEEEEKRFPPPAEVTEAKEEVEEVDIGVGAVTPVIDQAAIDAARKEASDEANRLAESIFEGIDDDDVDVRESVKLLADLKTKIEKGLDVDEEEKPESLAELFKAEKAKLGLDVLETELADLDADIEAIQTTLLVEAEKAGEKVISTREIGRAKGVLQKRADREIALLNIERSAVARQINNKLTTLETIMSFSQADMTNASVYYDKQITRSIQLYNLIKGVEEAVETRADKAVKSAQTNLTVLTNLFKALKVPFESLTDQNKADIRKLELEAGMPVGITEAFMSAKPNAELLTTVTGTNVAGEQIVTFIYKDEFGQPGTMVSKKTGVVKAPEEVSSIYGKYRDRLEDEIKNVYAGMYGKEGSREKVIDILKREFPDVDVAGDIYTRIPDGYEKQIKTTGDEFAPSSSDKSKAMAWLQAEPGVTDDDIARLKTDQAFFYWALEQANL